MSPQSPLSVLHLAGSAVDDFYAELSRLYAAAAVTALTGPRYRQHLAYVAPDGSWRFPSDLSAAAIARAQALSLADAITYLESLKIDVVVPQMFCLPGMTAYRGLLDMLKLNYLGNRPDVMALAADKAKARAVVAAAGVAVPAGELLRRESEWSGLPLPVVVKPVDADNSVGVSLVRDPTEYDTAVALAFAHADAVLVETYVELGREVRCGIIVRDGELICLPLEEYSMDRERKPIRGSDDKLARTGDGDLYLVAKDSTRAWIVPEDDPVTQRVWEAARRCHVALGCRHYSLFDFRIDTHGNPWFLEAGPYCSFAPSSVVAVMAAAAGLDVTALFAVMVRELNRERTP